MRRGQLVFTEAIGADGDTRTVQRTNGLKNEDLPGDFDRRVGDRVLEWLVDRYDISEGESEKSLVSSGRQAGSRGRQVGRQGQAGRPRTRYGQLMARRV